MEKFLKSKGLEWISFDSSGKVDKMEKCIIFPRGEIIGNEVLRAEKIKEVGDVNYFAERIFLDEGCLVAENLIEFLKANGLPSEKVEKFKSVLNTTFFYLVDKKDGIVLDVYAELEFEDVMKEEMKEMDAGFSLREAFVGKVAFEQSEEKVRNEFESVLKNIMEKEMKEFSKELVESILERLSKKIEKQRKNS